MANPYNFKTPPPLFQNGKVRQQPPFQTQPLPWEKTQTPAQANAAQVAAYRKKSAALGVTGQGNGPPIPKANPADQIRAMQQFLRNRGYDIAVDGIRGPETNAAVLAFHQHVPPAKYNSKGKPVKPGGPNPPAPTTPPPPSTVPPVKGPKGPSTPTVDPSTGQLIDPAAWAAGQVNAQYDPQINEILRQEQQGTAQAGQNQKDIAAWYKQLNDLATLTGKRDSDTAAAAASGYDASGQAASHLFGDQNSDPTFHDIQAGGLAANAEDQGVFDNRMKAIMAAAGVQSGVNQKRIDAQSASDLAAKLLDLRGSKGQAYSSAFQQGQQARTQQEAAQQSLDLAKALAPAQVATAQANAQTAQTNASTAAATSAANLKLLNARVKAAQIAASSNGGQGWNLSRPNDRGQLTSALRTGLQTKLGGFRVDPISAASNLQQALVQAGLQNDPQAQAIANSLLQETLTNAHAKHLWGGFKWDGTKVVRSGKHFDPKTGKLVKGQNG